MKLEEAIRILKIDIEDCDRLNEPRNKEALKLGIEALQWRLKHERASTDFEFRPLPGQTKEGGE